MLMLEQRIQQQFYEAADLHNQAAQDMSRPLALAAELLAACITAGGKLLVAGTQSGQLLAPVVSLAFAGRHERDRPPLAALALRDEPLASLAQQVGALGQPGDLLLLIDGGGVAQARATLREAAAAAHVAEMSVVVMVGASHTHWQDTLAETDVLLAIPHERPSRVTEVQLMLMHTLCDAVDLQLMGEQESP
jgi:D-sedoheptulose 7-phosphate isomerase